MSPIAPSAVPAGDRPQAVTARIADARLYAILDLGYTPPADAMSVTSQLLEGGADILQLRGKGLPVSQLGEIAATLAPLCRDAGVPFIINDHTAIAIAVGADGVHLGQDDGDISHTRALLAPSRNPNFASPALIGRSTHSPAQAYAALADGADYIGFGPLYATPTKPGRPAIGLADIAAVEREIGARIPVFCIGGIGPATSDAVLAAGARRVVVVSALLTASDIAAATRAAKSALRS